MCCRRRRRQEYAFELAGQGSRWTVSRLCPSLLLRRGEVTILPGCLFLNHSAVLFTINQRHFVRC